MTTGSKVQMTYEQAKFQAEVVMRVLGAACTRIEIAGSLRRKKAVIGDIELVAIPRFAENANLLDELVSFHSLLDEAIAKNYRVVRGDEKFKKLDVGMCYCDLFIQPDPATWGVNMMIRTGSADFSKWMVAPRYKGGAMPSYMRSHGARLWAGDQVLETPEEEDVFEAIGLRWIEPEDRTQGYWDQVQRFLKR